MPTPRIPSILLCSGLPAGQIAKLPCRPGSAFVFFLDFFRSRERSTFKSAVLFAMGLKGILKPSAYPAVRPTTSDAPAPTPLRRVQPPFDEPAPAAGPRRSKRPELWRAFQQNENGRAPVRRGSAVQLQHNAKMGGPAAAIPANKVCPGVAAQWRPISGVAAQGSGSSVPTDILKPGRRLAPLSRASLAPEPTRCRKRKAAAEFDAQDRPKALRATSSPKSVPMCLCCGGMLDAMAGSNRVHRQESRLLKCSKCGLTSRVAA